MTVLAYVKLRKMLILMVASTYAANEMPTRQVVTQGDMHATRYGEETINKQVAFRDPVSNSEMDYPDNEEQQIEREPPSNWGSANSPYTTTTLDDPISSYPPYLPPVLEEASSFSEGRLLLARLVVSINCFCTVYWFCTKKYIKIVYCFVQPRRMIHFQV